MADRHFSLELKTAIAAAKAGAKKALSHFKTDLIIERKADNSVVTKADRETEVIIKKCIQKTFPDAKFVAEESGGTPNKQKYWIIDPIDGTRSYTRGVSSWCVLIALCRENEMILGVCYFPVYNTLLYAEKGKGAFIDGRQVHVSQVAKLRDAYIGTGSIRHFTDRKPILTFVDKASSTRSMDSTYMNYFVAQGNMDANIDGYGNLWDIAPFMCIIKEAGGKVTNLQGKEYMYGDRGFIVSNGVLHAAIVNIVNKKN